MTTLYFLSIPIILLIAVGLIIFMARERRPDSLDASILTFNSEMGALAPPGADALQHDPLRPVGYPHVPDPNLPLDVLLAEDAKRQTGPA